MKLRIIGCPRSGTHYITKVLREQGLDIKHQKWGKDGIVSWSAMFDDGIYGASREEDGILTLHQIREPLNTIGSLTTIVDGSWDFIMSKIPEIKEEDSLLLKCMKMYVEWNTMCENLAFNTYMVENIGSSKESSREHKHYKLADLIEEDKEWAYKVIDLANWYGYILCE